MSKLFVQAERVEDLIGRMDDYFTKPKQKRKPSTNADRFREMEDEKIAEWMSNKVDCQYCPVRSEWCMESEASCRSNWLDWLKEEAD